MSARDAAPQAARNQAAPSTPEPLGPAAAARPQPVQEASNEGSKALRTRAERAPGTPTDEQFVERAKAGDQAALRHLIERYQRRLYVLALSMMKDHEDALDVVQETFVKVHRNIGGFNGDAQFFTWIYRIAYNCSIDAMRRNHRGEKVEVNENTLTDEGDHYEPYSPTSQSPQKAALRGELSDELQRALATLSENHRAILLLREVDGLSYEEIAQTLKIPKGTVMSRLFHARHRMQTAMKGYLGEDAPGEDDGP